MEEKIEVELRAKITPEIAEKITKIDGKESFEHDIYFSYAPDPDRTWIARTRIKNKKALLTFKSKKKFGEGAWSEVELPITIKHSKQLSEFFLSNGFFVDVEIKKTRKSVKIKNMSVNIDTIDKLGMYIEAELMVTGDKVDEAKKEIAAFFESLEIEASDITPEGYVSLMRDFNSA